MKLKDLPEFEKIINQKEYDSDLTCNSSKVSSLEGCPSIIKGDFFCSYNIIDTLKYSPEIVEGSFHCCSNKIKSLENSNLKIVKGNLNLKDNLIMSLKGLKNISFKDLYIDNNYLQNLEGCPDKIEGHLNCRNNDLKSLKGCAKEIDGYFDIKKNKYLKENVDIKQEIILNQIKAKEYYTDEGNFTFDELKEEFEKYEKYLKKEKEKEIKQEQSKKIKENKSKINTQDFGLSI